MSKFLKKVTSILMVLALVLGMVSISPMKAKASGGDSDYPIWDMQAPYEVIVEVTDEGTMLQLSVQESGMYRIYSQENEASDPYAHLYDSDMNLIVDRDDDNGHDFEMYTYLEAGEIYYLYVCNYLENVRFTVYCEFDRITGIELYDKSPVILYEEYNGDWNYDSDDNYFQYNYYDSLNSLKLQLNYADGGNDIFYYYDLHNQGMDITCADSQHETHWTLGEGNYYTISCLGKTIQVPVTIKEFPFASFEVTKNPTAKYVIGDTIHVWEDGEGGYWFNPRILSGLEVTFTKEDGSTYIMNCEEMISEGFDLSSATIQIDGVGIYEAEFSLFSRGATYLAEVVAEPDGEELVVGTEYTINDPFGYAWYRFEAPHSAVYHFSLGSLDGELGNSCLRIYNSDMQEISYSDDWNGSGSDMSYEMEEGVIYFLHTGAHNWNDGFTLTVKKEPQPAKVEVLGAPIEIDLHTNGYYTTDDDGNLFYNYYIDELLHGRTIRITNDDGTHVEGVYDTSDGHIENWYVDIYSEQYDVHWTMAGANVLYVEISGVIAEIPVKIKKPSTTTIKLDTAYTYNADKAVLYSFTPTQSGAYRFYSYNAECDPFVRLFDSDFVELSYDDDSGEGTEFVLVANLEAGKTYFYQVNAYGDEVELFNVKITRQKIATDLRIVSGEIVLIDNVDGDIRGEDEDDYFYYFYEEQLLDMIFEVTLDDGSKHQMRVYDAIEGIELEYFDNQYEEHWYRDAENYITVTWFNQMIQVPVTIVENPVVGISFVNVSEAPEYVLGDMNYMYEDEEGSYQLYPEKWEGLQLKVDYRDGSSDTFTLDEKGFINDYYVNTQYVTVDAAGEYQAIYTYMGNECVLTVNVVETPIASIEVVKNPDVANIPNYAMPNFTGAEIVITYKDTSTKKITVTEDMIGFDNWNVAFTIEADDVEILCYSHWEDSILDTVWYLNLLGMECAYDGITYFEKETTSFKASNITPDGTGMKLAVSFSDGTTKEYVVDPIYTQLQGNYYTGYMRADGGFVAYDVYIGACHPDGTPCAGGIYAFDRSIDFEEDHKMIEVPAKAATCTADGNIAHFKCGCGQLFADRAGKQSLTAAQVKVAKHTAKYVKAVAATKKKNGNKAHYACSCGKLYLDAACTKIVTKGDVTLAIVDKTNVAKVTGKKKALTVKWKKKSGVTGYEVEVALKKTFKKGLKKAAVKGAKKVSATVKGLKAKKTYYVRVRAYKIVNGKAFYSDWSKVVKKKTK